jgi:pyruvate dehydrogenase E2 component (dihydrolipoamide acetyltransferase)
MVDFKMPSLGADMEDAKLVEWLKGPGEAVRRGDIVAVVETQKGAIEIEVFEDGVLEEHVVDPGAVLPVGAVMARIRGGAEAAKAPPGPPPKRTPAAPPPAPPPARPPKAKAAARVPASPAARRLAQERGVDLAGVSGSGPGGAITYADVAAHAAAAPPTKPPGYDFAAMRAAIAAAMARSKREIPHYYLAHTIDIGAAQDWVAAANADLPPAERYLLGALFIKAAALAAREFPEFNGFHVDGAFRPSEAIHVGAAIAIRGGGLVAPALHDAADLELSELMSKLRDLVARVRAGRFRSSEIADPTITVSSLGDRGVEALWGVIYPPQVAIVGFGAPVVRPWAKQGGASGEGIAARPTVAITLAADHRVSDGHRGALFLERIGSLLEEPDKL